MKGHDSYSTRRTFLRGLLAGASALAVTGLGAACGPPAPGSAPTASNGQQQQGVASGSQGSGIKIGLLSGFSGPYAAFGPDMANAIQLYLDLHSGAVGGLKATVVQEDEGATTQDAVSKARKLVQQDQVEVLLGVVSSANALAIRDMLDQSKVPTIITNANANAITGEQRSDYIFRTALSAWQTGSPLGRWAAQNVGKKLVALAPDYAAGHEWTAGFKEDFGNFGGTVIDEQYPPLGNTDYAPYLAKIKPLNPDGVWAGFAGSDLFKFVQQYSQFIGASLPLVGVLGVDPQQASQLQKDALVITAGSAAWDPSLDNPTNKVFVAESLKRWNTTLTYGNYTFDAMILLDKILQTNGGDKSSAGLVKGFSAVTEFDSVRGTVKIDSDTHGLIIEQWRTRPVEDGGQIQQKLFESLGTFASFKRLA